MLLPAASFSFAGSCISAFSLPFFLASSVLFPSLWGRRRHSSRMLETELFLSAAFFARLLHSPSSRLLSFLCFSPRFLRFRHASPFARFPPRTLLCQAVDRFTTFGVVWEGACRLPIQWSAECSRVFAACGIPAPPPAASLEDAEAAEALAAEAAGQAVRSQTIKAYKSMVSLRKKPSVFSLLRRQGCSLAPAGEAPRPADDGHQCEQEETTTTEEKTEKERVEPAAVVEKEVGRGTEKAGEQEGEKETNGQDETQQLLGAAEAPGLVGEEISRRLSKPAEAMQGAEDNAQNSEEEKPQAHAERKTERAGDGKEAEKTRHDAASAEAEAAQATSQESPGGPPESKNSTRASPTAAPVEKVKSKKCCGACKIQ
ncbi:CRAL/TRIO domain-containing protein [Toxoplasma gondii RUB]|uniref:CRAL/TRIO domain-containing protein n=1 Tax=Toxoplasma gondii RUB TaxID=935652 RepID=A0A086LTK4_TOXGO|nr:CRAL/TRIO domain-containing protein [Toxoplasma gondii RUB]